DVIGLRFNDRQGGQRARSVVLVELGGALQQPGVEVEYVARVGFAARRPPQQKRHLAVGDRLLGEVIVNDDRVHAVVAEELANRAPGKRGEELHWRRVRRGGGDDDGIFERAVLFQHLDELRNRRTLLSDSD